MVKITADLIQKSPQYLNPVKEYYLNLKGNKILEIENLVSTRDIYNSIDLSNNSITRLPILPKLNNLNTLILIGNKINTIDELFYENTPFLKNLILTNNQITNTYQLETLSKCKTLKRLSLVDNLIAKMKHYRLFVIYSMPNLKILDFTKVKLDERKKAKKLFNSKEGKVLLNNIKEKGFIEDKEEEYSKLYESYLDKINKKQAIINKLLVCNNLDEIKKLEELITKNVINNNDYGNNINNENIKNNLQHNDDLDGEAIELN